MVSVCNKATNMKESSILFFIYVITTYIHFDVEKDNNNA
jgi:hypothetical protein